jgi:hypothetical protein
MATLSRLALIVFSLLVISVVSCGGPPPEEDAVEEIETPASEVPEPVRIKADDIAAILDPQARVDRWYWDQEDTVWECIIVGLPRITEIDLEVDAGFSELELVYGFDEVASAIPYLAEMVKETCKDIDRTLLELSIRREELIEPDPDLAVMWQGEDVFFEVQCPDGYDFEVDPYGSAKTRPDDDIDVYSWQEGGQE